MHRVAPVVGEIVDRLQLTKIGASVVETAQTVSQEVTSNAPSTLALARCTRPSPPVGTVEVVVFVEHDDGSIPALSQRLPGPFLGLGLKPLALVMENKGLSLSHPG